MHFSECHSSLKLCGGGDFAIFLEEKWKDFIHCLPRYIIAYLAVQCCMPWNGLDSNSASITSQVYGLEHNV